MASDEWTNWQIAEAFGIKCFRVKLWRDVLTFPSRKLWPDLDEMAVLQEDRSPQLNVERFSGQSYPCHGS